MPLPTLPLILEQTPTLGRWLCVVSTLFVLIGVGFRAWEPDLGKVVLVPVLAAGSLSLLLGGLLLWRPGRLLLSAQGLTLETFILRRQGSWTWQQVSAFTLEKVWAGKQRVEIIRFTSTTAGRQQPQALPTYWQRPVQEVVALLNQARAQGR